jgi:hypothetical protein
MANNKTRSPNYPAIGLAEAVEATRRLWTAESRTAVDIDTLAKAWGYNSVSGRVRSKLAAARKYGLVEDLSGGTRVSDLGLRVVAALPDDPSRLDALREAAMRPGLFRELYDTHLKASEQAIKSHLILKKGFMEGGAREAAKAFRETIGIAELGDGGYNPSSESGAPDAEGDDMSQNQALVPASHFSMGPSAPMRDYVVSTTGAPPKVGAALVESWTLSVPRNVKAELRIYGDVKREDVMRLKKQIEFLEESFESEGVEDAG